MTRTALDAFIEHKTAIDKALAELTEDSANFFGAEPTAINWGHVGSLEEIAKRLREILDFAH